MNGLTGSLYRLDCLNLRATCVELLGSAPLRSRTIADFSSVVSLVLSYLRTRYSSNRDYQRKGPAQAGFLS